jgi:hypothetical protein
LHSSPCSPPDDRYLDAPRHAFLSTTSWCSTPTLPSYRRYCPAIMFSAQSWSCRLTLVVLGLISLNAVSALNVAYCSSLNTASSSKSKLHHIERESAALTSIFLQTQASINLMDSATTFVSRVMPSLYYKVMGAGVLITCQALQVVAVLKRALDFHRIRVGAVGYSDTSLSTSLLRAPKGLARLRRQVLRLVSLHPCVHDPPVSLAMKYFSFAVLSSLIALTGKRFDFA